MAKNGRAMSSGVEELLRMRSGGPDKTTFRQSEFRNRRQSLRGRGARGLRERGSAAARCAEDQRDCERARKSCDE
jgi:hypothetical protein